MKRFVCLLLVFVCSSFCFSACGAPAYSQENSPQLVESAISTYHEGSETQQYMRVLLQFDRDVQVRKSPVDNLRITIADNRVQEEDSQWRVDENAPDTVELLLRVDAVYDGKLHIEPLDDGPLTGITDAAGQYAAAPFTLDRLTPSGIVLSSAPAPDGQTAKQVEGRWNIRSIAWLQLWDNGDIVPSSVTDSLEVMDGAIAVHGHDFLLCDETDIAGDICETLTHHFGQGYLFTAEGPVVFMESRDKTSDHQLDLKIYLY